MKPLFIPVLCTETDYTKTFIKLYVVQNICQNDAISFSAHL